jgi:serralysin
LWGGSRIVRHPGHALDSLYEGLGITPEIYARRMRESDNNADGTVDQRGSNTYDASGNYVMEEFDLDGDGTMDYRDTYIFDANGNYSMYEYDEEVDDTVDSRETFTNQLLNSWMFIYWNYLYPEP